MTEIHEAGQNYNCPCTHPSQCDDRCFKAEISPDIMQKAEEAYHLALHDSMAGKPDYLKHIALAILGERQKRGAFRHAK